MKTLISIVGPTASGKTALAIRLAMIYETVILSADSRQMYRYMDIGTSKPTPEERKKAKHYFLDILDPDESYSAGRFEADAEALLADLFRTHEVVVVAGGSTLYMDALWNGFDEMPEIPPGIREELNREFQENGLENLLTELAGSDPDTFVAIDKKNPARVIRALEVIRASGLPYSSFRKGRNKKNRTYRLIKIGLQMDRNRLYERINHRVEQMMQAGLPDEVEKLMKMGYSPECKSLQSIGYGELVAHFQGMLTLGKAVAAIQQNSRRYAKRQLTWFRRDPEIRWFDAEKAEEAEAWVRAELEG
jgi:tRNA dimethylallyltransferase